MWYGYVSLVFGYFEATHSGRGARPLPLAFHGAGADFVVQSLKMRPSLPRLVRVLPRSAIALPELNQAPPKIYDELPKSFRMSPSLLEVLLKEKELAGSDYPPNIRIESPVSKKTFAGVKRDLVAPLRAILRER
jgi:hypothetical protein